MQNKISSLSSCGWAQESTGRIHAMRHAWAFLDRGCDSIIILLMLASRIGWLSFPVIKVRRSSAYLSHCHWCKGDARNVQQACNRATFQAFQAITLFPTASLQPAGSRRLYSIRYHLCKARAISSFEISTLVLHTSRNPWNTSEPQPQCQGSGLISLCPIFTRNKIIYY